MTRTQNKPLKIGESGCCHKNLSLPFEAASTSTSMTDLSPSEIKTALGFEDGDRDTLVDIFWPAFKFHAKVDWIYKSDVQKEKEASAQINSNRSKQQAKSNLNRKKLERESISEFWRILS